MVTLSRKERENTKNKQKCYGRLGWRQDISSLRFYCTFELSHMERCIQISREYQNILPSFMNSRFGLIKVYSVF